ncbi:MaoC family dehydratase [Patulibacter defluvii]|uniref:MaoC family dehydratase n=1 Tax=Patulibacter defluvii TaxID=3095358 RepID=UPI002A766AC3|nr:MaoC family dehydratase [Patulibacter sp. DM4]
MSSTPHRAALSVQQLSERVGEELGVSSWREVSQATVDAFAEVTGDHQWIHTDPERAASGPFGGTIAHGYLTLALAPVLFDEILALDHFPMSMNYGLDRLRFVAPLAVGSRIRLRARLDAVDPIPGGATLKLTLTFEADGSDKPVCVAQPLYRVLEQLPG